MICGGIESVSLVLCYDAIYDPKHESAPIGQREANKSLWLANSLSPYFMQTFTKEEPENYPRLMNDITRTSIKNFTGLFNQNASFVLPIV